MFTLFKYLVWLAVSLLCLMLATISISEYLVASAIDAPYDEKLSDFARMLAGQVRAGHEGAVIGTNAIGLLRSDSSDRVFYALRGPDGNVLGGDPRIPAFPGALEPGKPALHDGEVGDDAVRVVSLQIPDPVSAGQTLTVQVAETLNKRHALTEALRGEAVALPQVLVLVVAILLIVYGYAYVLRPMQQLRLLIDRRGSGDLSPLDPESAPHDLRPLILSINGLMERLAAIVDAQRRFIADAAHQLRTPLAGLRSQTEIALLESDPAALRPALERLAAGTERATKLANRLLTLARAESPLVAPQAGVDLLNLARDTITDHLPQANARGQDLGFEGPVPSAGPVAVRGDPLLLRELLSNLVDNALRYTPDGGVVTVSVTSPIDAGTDRNAGRGPTLSVTDTGPGVPAGEREKVFEPFYRGSEAMAPGTGLGLAIVRSIAAAHRASLTLCEGPGGRGLHVAVTFPPVAAT